MAVLEITDDGVGLVGQARPDALGLVGMRERAVGLGGAFEVRAGPGGRGTRVSACVPLSPPVDEAVA
jgi:signal transduction histidine kinase